MEEAYESRRGRDAERPREVPARGWKDALLRVKRQVQEDHVALMAAGMAFYAVLALFPTLIALVTLYGLVATPADVEATLSGLSGNLPAGAADLMRSQLHSIAASSSSALGVGLVLGLLGALWSASSGALGMIKAVNIAYDEPERRGFFALRGLALLFTLGGLVMCILAVGLVGVLPAFFERLGLDQTGRWVANILPYVALVVLVLVGLALVYRYAPSRDHAKLRWLTPGAVVAALLWIAATAAFDFYASRFGNYQETYGAIGGVILLLMWLFLSSFAVLIGAEINSELEAQTAKDSTVGPPRSMGRRGARKADRLGEAMS